MGCGCAGSTKKGTGAGSTAKTQTGGGAVGDPGTFFWNGPRRPRPAAPATTQDK